MTNETPASPATDVAAPEENQLIAERREKLKRLRQIQADGGAPAFPNHFKPTHHAAQLHETYDHIEHDALNEQAIPCKVAGRMMLKRVMGKASFATIQDGSFGPTGGRIQLYITRDGIGEEAYAEFKQWDLGDIIGAEGVVFKTKTGELSVKVNQLHMITKSLRPLPDKFHGIADQEIKYRQRYVDLITDEQARKRFVLRSKAIASIRQFMLNHDFLEVETPMLHPIPGGANAKPFVTHHNALDQDMYLRIAPELYLKRLLVGGFERVFEINRNFRNEGISVRHNPEFTMMEYYAAYWNYQDQMNFIEELIRHVAIETTGSAVLTYQGKTVDLSQPFARLTIRNAILQYNEGVTPDNVDSVEWLQQQLARRKIETKATESLASLQVKYFEETVEEKLWNPTFIMEHPTEISPLARASDSNPLITERFELYVTGREFGNAFSELNDAEDQSARFKAQVDAKDSGDDEAMYYDADFIRSLEYGMPYASGCGIGIDRLMMLLTDSPSIRDVILFPALRKVEEQ
ncbi:Lysine--tRNA ligase [Saezia sanguinis]|uniref:Lysine--tRNA ligase n=1 Tax=Saezia sanguinis TaxID=1965230 RepID=A0A433SEZ2_9BURK|nr:lysine--tRNA ligase [Saezia sanguinis]RUS67308.1 Lysine--tRNA ligase [Saezia sanguinis]